MKLEWTCRETRSYTAAGKRGAYEMREFSGRGTTWVILWLNDQKVTSELSFDEAAAHADALETA